MDKIKPIPHEVIIVESIPECNFCKDGTPGPYDFKMAQGPWANGCYDHYRYHAAYGTLGLGKGQLWITPEQADLTTEGIIKQVEAEEGQIMIDGPLGKHSIEWYADSANFDGDLVDLL